MRRARAARIAVAVAVGVVVVAGAWAFFLRGGSGNGEKSRSGSAVDIARGEALARESCAAFSDAERLIRANESSDDVLASTDRARDKAEAAAEVDPLWRPLAGGTAAVDVALREDDPRAARVGVDVVRAECERLTGASPSTSPPGSSPGGPPSP